MPLKFSIKIPSSSSAAIAAKLKPLVEKAFADATPKIAALVVDRVTQEADMKLKSMAPQYKRAVQDPDAVKVDEHGLKIHIKDPVVLALELGVNSFDIKAKMLPHAQRFGRSGPYIDVPFSHRPYSATKGEGVPKSVLSSLFKKADKAGPEESVRSGVKGAAPRQFERSLSFGGSTVTTQVKHKVGIHENMIYARRATGGVSQSSFKTIRRISSNSDPMSWWHPGFTGLGIFRKVFNEVNRDVNRIIGDSFRVVGLKARFK